MKYTRAGAKRKKGKYGVLFHLFFLAIATVLSIMLCIFSLIQYIQIRRNNVQLTSEVSSLSDELEHSYTKAEVDQLIQDTKLEQAEISAKEERKSILDGLQDHLMNGGTVLDALKTLYPDDIIVADNGYHFIPISDQIKHHTYVLEQFVPDEDGYLQYQEGGEILSKKGIDVSRYQEKIDWNKVARSDIEYAFIRSGIRGYTKGDIIADERFVENIEGALAAELEVGVYFVTQAISPREAIEEAEFVIEQIEEYEVTYPVVIDVEDVGNGNARSQGLSMDERTECIIAFCDRIREAGYEPMIYGNMKSFMRRMNLEQLEDYKKWIAYYDKNLYFPYDFDVWQYTDKGTVNGIKGNVDYNVSFYHSGS